MADGPGLPFFWGCGGGPGPAAACCPGQRRGCAAGSGDRAVQTRKARHPPALAPPLAATNSSRTPPPHPSPCPELGIDIGAILRSTKAILLHQMRSPALDSLDFGGALVFLLALGGLHLLVGAGPGSAPGGPAAPQRVGAGSMADRAVPPASATPSRRRAPAPRLADGARPLWRAPGLERGPVCGGLLCRQPGGVQRRQRPEGAGPLLLLLRHGVRHGATHTRQPRAAAGAEVRSGGLPTKPRRGGGGVETGRLGARLIGARRDAARPGAETRWLSRPRLLVARACCGPTRARDSRKPTRALAAGARRAWRCPLPARCGARSPRPRCWAACPPRCRTRGGSCSTPAPSCTGPSRCWGCTDAPRAADTPRPRARVMLSVAYSSGSLWTRGRRGQGGPSWCGPAAAPPVGQHGQVEFVRCLRSSLPAFGAAGPRVTRVVERGAWWHLETQRDAGRENKGLGEVPRVTPHGRVPRVGQGDMGQGSTDGGSWCHAGEGRPRAGGLGGRP